MKSKHLTPDSSPSLEQADQTVNSTRRKLLAGAGLATAGSFLTPALSSAKTRLSDSPSSKLKTNIFHGKIPDSLPEGYNILFILTDQERYFKDFPAPLPGRERLKKMGTTFTQHYINTAVCTSSRATIYTGLHMPQTKMFDNIGMPWMPWDLDPKSNTVGNMMQQVGYYPAYFGKWHLNRVIDNPAPGINKDDIADIPVPKLHKIMESYGFNDYQGFGDVIGNSQGGYFYDAISTSQALSWLRRVGRRKADLKEPWFLAVNIVNPHDVMFIDTDEVNERTQWRGELGNNANTLDPAQPPENELYRASWKNYPLPANRHQSFKEKGRPAAQLEFELARAGIVGDFPDQDRRWRKLLDYYINCIRDSDTHINNLINELEALGLLKNTIIVLTADHGELGGAHQMHGKGTCVFEEQVHVPLTIVHPDFPGNQTCDVLTSHLDITPTLISLTGASEEKKKSVLKNRKGKDMTPLLKNPKADKNSLHQAILYTYGMILYTDAKYTNTLMSIRRQNGFSISEKQQVAAMSKLRPDYSNRSGIRMVFDGRYKFARYFSLREHNTPETWEKLLTYNDLELYDLKNDPLENHNLAADKEKYKGLIMSMNAKLNAIISEEIGIDDGSFMPNAQKTAWNLTASQFERLIRD